MAVAPDPAMRCVVVFCLLLAACASAPEIAAPLGPASVPLETARAENPAPIAAPEPDAGAAELPVRDGCPLAIAGTIAEAEGVPNGMAIVFRKLGAEAEVRELTRRWFGELDMEGVAVRVSYSDAPDGAMVTFVPEELDEERENVNAVRDTVQKIAEEMRASKSCPSSVRPRLVAELSREPLQKLARGR